MNTDEEVGTMLFIAEAEGLDAALEWLDGTFTNPGGEFTPFGTEIAADFIDAYTRRIPAIEFPNLLR